MDENTAKTIVCTAFLFCFFGWIPILAIGKVIQWILEEIKNIKERKE